MTSPLRALLLPLFLSFTACAVDDGGPGTGGGKADDLSGDVCDGATVDDGGFCRAASGRFAPADCCLDDQACESAAPDADGVCRRGDNGRFAPAICCEALCNDAALDVHGICRSEDGRFAPGACCNDECADPDRDPARSCGDETPICGGFAGLQCGDGQFCSFEPGAFCGAGDQTGTCQDMPVACNAAENAPVCGCNGETFSSACTASVAGVSVRSQGRCP